MNTKLTYQDLENQIAELKRQNEKLEIANREITEYNRFFLFSSGMMCISTGEYLVKINPTFTKIFGYQEKELLEAPFLFFIHPDDVQKTTEQIEKLKQGIPTSQFVNRWRCKDNSYRWLDWTASPDTQEGLIYAVARDITEHKQAEEALLRSEEETSRNLHEIEQIYTYSPIGLFVFDREYRFTRINERMAEINGFPVAHHIGKTLDDIIPELAPFLKEVYRPIFERGEPVLNVEIHGKTPKDQNTERDWIGNYFPLRSESGEVIGLIGIVLEITERKLAEEKLKQSEEKYKLLYESNLMPISVFETESLKFLSVNDAFCKKYGYSREEFLNMTILDIRPKITTEIDKIKESISQKDENVVNAGVFTHQKRNGELIEAEIIRSEINFEGKNAKMVVVNDVTQRNKAEAALKESERLARIIADNIPSMVGYWDSNLLCTFANTQYLNWFGYTPSQMIGMHIKDLMGEELFKKNEPYILAALQGNPQKFERTLIKSDGEISHTWAQYIPNQVNGQVQGFFVIVTDISEIKQTEQRLILATNQLRGAQKLAKIGSWETDVSNLAVSWSEQTYNIFELDTESFEASHQAFLEFVYPDDRAKVDAAFFDSFSSDSENAIEHRIITARGNIKYVEEHWKVIKDVEGKPVRVLGSCQDITERKQAQEALMKSLKDVSDYKYALDISAIVAITDQNGIITYVNDNFCKLSKYSKEELIGQSHKIINSGFHPNEFFLDLWGTIENGKIWKGEIKNKAKDGTFYWVDTTIIPFADGQGKPYQYLAIRSDITENKIREFEIKTAKEKIIESEERFRQLAENTNEIFWVRTQNEMLYINSAFERIFGLPCEMIYKNPQLFTDFIHPDDKPAIISFLQSEAFKKTGLSDFEYRIVRPDNQIRWLRAKSYPIYGEAGEIIRRSGIAVDITQDKQQELHKEKITKDLIQRNKALEQFSYILSHNLRSPLSTIMGLTDMLQDEELSLEEIMHINKGLAESAMRLDEVFRDINQILDVRQSILDKKELVRFEEIVSNILINNEPIIANKNAVITWDFSQVGEMVTVKSYIYSIFYNLISNSLKYCRPDIPPQVEINSELINNKIILHFKDNGMGIDLKKQGEKIFGLYKRFHHGHAEGKGIGLFMVKTQVETIGGVINVSSEVNKGTIFSIEFEL